MIRVHWPQSCRPCTRVMQPRGPRSSASPTFSLSLKFVWGCDVHCSAPCCRRLQRMLHSECNELWIQPQPLSSQLGGQPHCLTLSKDIPDTQNTKILLHTITLSLFQYSNSNIKIIYVSISIYPSSIFSQVLHYEKNWEQRCLRMWLISLSPDPYCPHVIMLCLSSLPWWQWPWLLSGPGHWPGGRGRHHTSAAVLTVK